METVLFLKDWVIPIASVLLSVWFAASAKKDAERAQQTLEQVDRAIQGWQSEIMASATNILNSMPQVVEGKKNLASANALELSLQMIDKKLDDGGSPAEVMEALRQIGQIATRIAIHR